MNSFGLRYPRGRAPLRERHPRLKPKLLESIAAAFPLRWQDSLLPINHLGKRYTETAEKPIEFDLSFTDPETAPLRPRGQKPRVYSLGINPYSHSSEYRPYFAVLKYGEQMAKSQVKGSKKAKRKPPSQRGNGGPIIGFTHQCRWWICRDSRTKRNSAAHSAVLKSAGQNPVGAYSHSMVAGGLEVQSSTTRLI